MNYYYKLLLKTSGKITCKLIMVLVLLSSNSVFALEGSFLQKTVRGKIVSSMKGETLVGVTIAELGTTNGTFSDINGEFTIVVSGTQSSLRFSYIGYLTETVVVGDQSFINIVLVEDITLMDEVVVVGYGVQRKSDLTGSVESVNTSEMQKLAVPSIAEALQGRASGVYVTRGSGQPGTTAKIYVRGPGSVNNTDPLYVIDGVPSSAGNHFDMADVESIEILKDASAAAIYGARAANGVILITTKRGGNRKPTINFRSSFGLSQPLNLPDLVNSSTFAQLRYESYLNGNFQPGLNQVYTQIVNTPDTVLPVSTDWMDILYKNGATQTYNLDFSGGNERSTFFTSLGYFKEEGTYINTWFDRITATLNSDHKISGWFDIGQSLNLSKTRSEGRHINQFAALRVNPFMKLWEESVDHPYKPYGLLPAEYGFMGPNPYGIEDMQREDNNSYRLAGNIYVNLKLLKGLNWRSTFGGNFTYSNNQKYTEPYDLGHTLRRDIDQLEVRLNSGTNLLANSVVNYRFDIERHGVELMAGAERENNGMGGGFSINAENFRDGLIIIDQSDPETRSTGGSKYLPTRWLSQFGRVNYNYDSKYLFTLNIRRDGSSLFPPQFRYGIFPSFSAGWRITREPFMENLAQYIDLKLRAGYGAVGNPSVAPFSYFSQYRGEHIYYIFGGRLLTGLVISNFGSGDIKWESINTTNIGLDLYALDYKLNITNDFYIKDTRDMLINVDIPIAAGVGSGTIKNIGNIRNIGNDLSVEYKDQLGSFLYTIGGNIAFNRHKVMDIVDQKINQGDLRQFMTVQGLPMSYYEGYIVEGIWQEHELDNIIEILLENRTLANAAFYDRSKFMAPGDFKFKDLNGDGIINDEDRVNLGNPWPDYVFGLNLSAEYKGIDLSLFFQGVVGNDIYHINKRVTDNLTGDYSFTYNALDRWTPDNPSTKQPRIVYGDPNNNLNVSSSYFVESGTYMRLKNLQVGYTIPKDFSARYQIDQLRIFISGQNLLTFTQYTGMDPEISTGSNTSKNLDQGMYPQSRIFQAGLQLSF